MRRIGSITVALLARISCFLSTAYEIAFTDNDSEDDGYEYNFAFLSRLMGETCRRIPFDTDPHTGPSEVFVRAIAGHTPVPKFIGLYDNASPQLGKCNYHSLVTILAFDPQIFNRQQAHKVWPLNIWYWKDIDYNRQYPNRNYASSLISKFGLGEGEQLVKDPASLGWRHEEPSLEMFEWNEIPSFPKRPRRYQVSQRPMKIERVAAWMKDVGPMEIDESEPRFLLRLPDTPPGIGHGLEISDLADNSIPRGIVESIAAEPSEISEVEFRQDPYTEFLDGLGSLTELLNIHPNSQTQEESPNAS
ncbi:hypothetical protein TWF281_011659 [Arthrobotrys megalospora]